MIENPYCKCSYKGSALKEQMWNDGYQAGVKDALEEVEKELDVNKTFDSNYNQWQSLKKKLMGG